MNNLPFGFEEPERSPGFLLWQTTMNWQRLIKKGLEPYSISHAQFVIMANLLWLQNEQTSITQIDLIKMSKLDKMTVSKSLKKLQNMNLILREEDKKDTRAKSSRLNESGIALINKLVPIIEGIDAKFFGQLKSIEEQNLILLLQKLVMNKY